MVNRKLIFNTLIILAKTTGAMAEFQATNEWQVIPADQQIPPGLHVRLNMETGEKEVKLADKNDNDSGEENSLAVVSPNEGELVENSELLTKAVDQILKRQYDQATLDEVEEYSHELDFGERIARSGLTLELFRIMLNQDYSVEYREISARIFGASLKNNPESQKLLFRLNDEGGTGTGGGQIMSKILDALKTESTDKMKSRLLFVLGSLMTHQRGMDDFVQQNGNRMLQDIFENGTFGQKLKTLDFVWDHVLHSPVEQPKEWYQRELNYWSDILQSQLVQFGINNGDQLKMSMFETLVKISEMDPNLPIKKEFMKWLSKMSDEGSKAKNKDDEFYQLARKTRHTLFGNPNADRKHNAEEL